MFPNRRFYKKSAWDIHHIVTGVLGRTHYTNKIKPTLLRRRYAYHRVVETVQVFCYKKANADMLVTFVLFHLLWFYKGKYKRLF